MNRDKLTLSLDQLYELTKQLVLCLDEVHKREILHADVKLDNFLVKSRSAKHRRSCSCDNVNSDSTKTHSC